MKPKQLKEGALWLHTTSMIYFECMCVCFIFKISWEFLWILNIWEKPTNQMCCIALVWHIWDLNHSLSLTCLTVSPPLPAEIPDILPASAETNKQLQNYQLHADSFDWEEYYSVVYVCLFLFSLPDSDSLPKGECAIFLWLSSILVVNGCTLSLDLER